MFERRQNAADLGVALRVDLARKGIARIAEHAAAGLAGPDETEWQGRRMQSLSLQFIDDGVDRRRVRNGWERKWPARRLGRIDAVLAVHLIEALGAVVERLERLVVDGPRRRDAVDMLDFA